MSTEKNSKRETTCCVWDFTLSSKEIDGFQELKNIMKEHCKKYCFQLEQGEKTGFLHYQGRVSLKIKKRLSGVRKILSKAHWSRTSKANLDNLFYVTKIETRVSGPWKDSDPYIPRQIREIKKLYPWQQKLIEISLLWDTRHINLILDTKGNIGKSIICQYMDCYKYGRMIPFINDYKDILRMVYCIGPAKSYLIDMPRAMGKERLRQIFGAIEVIKSGYCYDDRYTFKSRHFDCPQVFVFTNCLPELSLLSEDRWAFWEVNNKELVRIKITEIKKKVGPYIAENTNNKSFL